MTKRNYGWRPDKKHDRERLGLIYRPSSFRAVKFPASFDLGAVPNPAFGPLDQGELGACTGFGCKRVAWYGLNALAQAAVPSYVAVEPSALFQYFNERKDDGDIDQDDGSTISEGVTALRNYGICPEKDWPYIPAKFAAQPPQNAYEDAMLLKALKVENIQNDGNLIVNLQDCLFNQKLPIVFGADLFSQFESAQCAHNGVVQMPPSGASPIGGHCQVIRGWKQTENGLLFQIQNSWGVWGDNGCDWMPDAYLQTFASDFWAVVQME